MKKLIPFVAAVALFGFGCNWFGAQNPPPSPLPTTNVNVTPPPSAAENTNAPAGKTKTVTLGKQFTLTVGDTAELTVEATGPIHYTITYTALTGSKTAPAAKLTVVTGDRTEKVELSEIQPTAQIGGLQITLLKAPPSETITLNTKYIAY